MLKWTLVILAVIGGEPQRQEYPMHSEEECRQAITHLLLQDIPYSINYRAFCVVKEFT